MIQPFEISAKQKQKKDNKNKNKSFGNAVKLFFMFYAVFLFLSLCFRSMQWNRNQISQPSALVLVFFAIVPRLPRFQSVWKICVSFTNVDIVIIHVVNWHALLRKFVGLNTSVFMKINSLYVDTITIRSKRIRKQGANTCINLLLKRKLVVEYM